MNQNFKLDENYKINSNINSKDIKLLQNFKDINQRYDKFILLDYPSEKNDLKCIILNNKIPPSDKNTFRNIKSSNLTIITNSNIMNTLNCKNIENFNKNLNSELIKNKAVKAKEIFCDTIENIGDILVIYIIYFPSK
jgi:hypothetical protein